MALTGTEQKIVGKMKALGATKEMRAVILMLLDEKEACQEELIEYMTEHGRATPRHLLEKTLEITQG